MKKSEIDFGWGDPYFLLKILDETYSQKLCPFNIASMSYAPDGGLEKLVNYTREVIFQTTGKKYKYILITNGATSAINCILRLSKKRGFEAVLTTEYGYPYYENMIKKANMIRVKGLDKHTPLSAIRLIDSPSNPEGLQYIGGNCNKDIWDAVYHTKIYTEDTKTIPSHRYLVSSYSKTLGLTGARVGFVATNDKDSYIELENESLMENATISIPSQELIVDILEKINLQLFINQGKMSLDYNKGEFQKIEYLFDNQPVQKNGMFYCAHADKKAIRLIKKCGIKYVNIEDDYIRFSMGQTNELVKKGIDRILKGDNK